MIGAKHLGFTLACFMLVQTSTGSVSCTTDRQDICKQDLCLYIRNMTGKPATCNTEGGASTMIKDLIGYVMEMSNCNTANCSLTARKIFCDQLDVVTMNARTVHTVARLLVLKHERKRTTVPAVPKDGPSFVYGQMLYLYVAMCARPDEDIFDDVLPLKKCTDKAVKPAAPSSPEAIDAAARENRRLCPLGHTCIANKEKGHLCYPNTFEKCSETLFMPLVALLKKNTGDAAIYADYCKIVP